MGFASRFSKLSRPKDMKGPHGSSNQITPIEGDDVPAAQSLMEGPATGGAPSDTSSGPTSSEQFRRITGRNASSGTRFGVGQPPARPTAKKARMTFGQRVGSKTSTQEAVDHPQRKADRSQIRRPGDAIGRNR